MYSCSEALVAFIGNLFILGPLQLTGAGILFPLVRMAMSRRREPLNPSSAG